ncbi:E3 SUMO-protein ligase PIAS2 [Taenia solium]|eukprot:TsM_000746600 transcript=TsM_000746600 gene=TsM_000746600
MISKTNLKEYIHSCKRKTLESLLKIAGLPTSGLKDSLIVRLVNYIDVGPSDEFVSEVNLMMQTAMSRFSLHPVDIQAPALNGSSMPEINSGTQSNADNVNKQPLMRLQQNANSLRIPPMQLPHQQQLAQPNLRSGHIRPTGTPTDPQNWGTFGQNSCDSRKSTFFPEPSRANTQVNGGFTTLPMPDRVVRLPICPLLRFEESPFYKVLDVIIPPTIMTPSAYNFTPGKRIYERLLDFRINSDQAETITYHSHRLDDNRREFGVQVLMRFGKLEPSVLSDVVASTSDSREPALAPFADSMPIHLNIFVNVKQASLPPLLPTCRPNMDGRRYARPVNITPLLRVSPSVSNHVKLSWSHDYSTFSYNFFAIYLVQKHSTKELCEALRTHAYRPAPVVQKQIVGKLASTVTSCGVGSGSGTVEESDDDDLQIQNTLPVQLLCPLSKCRIKLPVRGQRCQHIQCYDADTYLLINERKPAWKCPVCDSLAPFHELFVDGLLMDILAARESQDVEEIVFNEDGSWTTMRPNAGDTEVMIDLTESDDEDEPTAKRQPPPSHPLPPPSASSSLPSPPSSQAPSIQQVSSVSLPSHDSLSAQHSVPSQLHYPSQQQHHRAAPGSSNPVRYVHSISLTSMPSSTPYLVDAKPDPRRVCLTSLQASHSIPASRPCSHSATPSPRTPQSLGYTSTGVGAAAKPVSLQSPTSAGATPTPASFLSSAAASHSAIGQLTPRELFLKMATLYPQLTSQQIAEALTTLKMHEHNRHMHSSHLFPPPPPPKAAHQNSLSLPHPRRSFLPPTPAHSNLSALTSQQWRTHTTAASSPSLFVGSSSTPLMDYWPSSGLAAAAAAATTLTTVVPSSAAGHQGQSLGSYGASLSPPRAHSNHSSSPPRQGDPRHPEGGFLDLPHPPSWSTTNH